LYFGKTIIDDGICLIPLKGKDRKKNYREMIQDIFENFKKKTTPLVLLDGDSKCSEQDVFLVGTCDLEDSISNSVWLRLLREEHGLVIEESDLDNVRSELDPADQKKKFVPLLEDLLWKKYRNRLSLNKGEDLGLALASHMEAADIPSDILKLFVRIGNLCGHGSMLLAHRSSLPVEENILITEV
jgi:hypothetical protein